MAQPREHAELIKAWADGAVIQVKINNIWRDSMSNRPDWAPGTEYRIKPEREYPKSTLRDDELVQHYTSLYHTTVAMLRSVADAAVKKYIQETEDKNGGA